MAIGLLLAAALVSPWEATVSPGFATTGDIGGLAGEVSVLRAVKDWFAAGVTFESARLSASGQAPLVVLSGPPASAPYRFAMVSTFAGAMAQFRLPLGRFTASADVAAGWVEVSNLHSDNTQCGYGSGINLRLGAGVTYAVSESVSLGVRGALGSPGSTAFCEAVAGPWAFGFGPLYSLAPAVRLRF